MLLEGLDLLEQCLGTQQQQFTPVVPGRTQKSVVGVFPVGMYTLFDEGRLPFVHQQHVDQMQKHSVHPCACRTLLEVTLFEDHSKFYLMHERKNRIV